MPAQLSHHPFTLTALTLLTGLITACSAPPAVPTTTAVPAAGQTVTELPTAVTVPARPLPELDLRADLAALLTDRLAPTPTAAADGSRDPAIDGVSVLPLIWSDTEPLFVAVTTGMTFDSEAPHRVALYRYAAEWQLLGEVSLPDANYVDPAAVSQVEIDDRHAWIVVDSGVGAHGGCIDLLMSDGTTLEPVLHACSESPDTAMLIDIDNDGYGEVLLNDTDHYVFCYACGIRNVRWRILRWDGSRLVEKPLAAVNGTDAAAETANRAYDLAMAGRWKQADEFLGSTNLSGNLDAAWLAAVIRVNARLRLNEISASPYPLLSAVLAGDFAGATAVLRAVSAQQAADVGGPLIAGTVAEGNEDALWTTVIEVTERALAIEPDDSDALLLRGWAGLMQDSTDEDAAAALQRAAALVPDDAFISGLIAALR